MNIRELLEWRKQCYFCQEDLDIFPILGSSGAEFSLKDKFLNIKTQQYAAQIDLESGQIFMSKYLSPTIFLKSVPLTIEVKCVRCRDYRKYSYKGVIRNMGDGYAQVRELCEGVAVEGITITQIYFSNGLPEKETYLRSRGKSVARIPIVNLNKTPPDKLKNKLKTYLTFS